MSYNGSGTFQINTSGQPVVAGTVISSTAFNALTADLATGLSTAITKDGQTTATARIPFAAGISSTLTTDSSSVSTGSIITAGGAGIAKALYVGTTANVAGAVTLQSTLGVTGVATFSAAPIYSSLTASSAVATDASKALVSVTNTGTGNNVLATSPTLVTPVLGAASATSVTVAAGAVGTPSITTTGDTNTGIFFPAADTIAFAEGGVEAMRITSAGDVGIGTSSPSTKLHVEQSTTGDGFKVAKGGNYLIMGGSGSGTQYVKGFEGVVAFGNAFAGVTTFLTSDTERMRIDSSGYLLVNQTSNTTSSYVQIYGGQPALSVESTSTGSVNQIIIKNPNGTVGSISTSGSLTSYNVSSDYRLKNTIVPMTGALAKVALLKPCTYKWNVDGSNGQGFIAHELQEVIAGCVTGEKDAVETYTDEDGNEATRPVYQGIDTSFLVATLTSAIQELKALTDTQASTITTLTARITALEVK